MTGAIEVRGDQELILLIDQDSGVVLATAYAIGDGWWRGRDVHGRVRLLWPHPGTADPRLDVAERLARRSP